jgi:NADPH:quinone reductase-like Zn-dependent oxidoreductase
MKMKAIVYEKYGPPEVLHFKEVPKPVPKDNEILIKVHATTVYRGDVRVRSSTVPRGTWLLMRLYLGLLKPKRQILGMELAGIVEKISKNVKRFKEGDEVFAISGFNFGAYVEYFSMPAEGGDEKKGMVTKKPSNMTFGEAAAAGAGALTALSHIRKVNVQKDQKVLVYGASGSVGTFFVQLAKYHGADVTGMCSTSNLEMVRSLGADMVIDYKKEDFTKNGKKYDIIFDAVAKLPRSKRKISLKGNGTFDSVHSGGIKIKPEDLLVLKKIIEAGKLKSAIDRTYPWEKIEILIKKEKLLIFNTMPYYKNILINLIWVLC